MLHPPALSNAADDPAKAPPLLALAGFHLLIEALRAGLAPTVLFLRQGEEASALATLFSALSGPAEQHLLAHAEILALAPALFRNVLDTETPQPIAALLPAPLSTPHAVFAVQPSLLPVLCALQDPGNVGTLLRSARAFGATGALLLQGAASPWSGKSLRASAGAALRLPLLAVRDAEEAAELLAAHSVRSWAAVPEHGDAVEAASLAQPSALWIGNEGAGLNERELAACHARITLPMVGGSESLNAAVAGSLLLYEAARQRIAAASKLPCSRTDPTP